MKRVGKKGLISPDNVSGFPSASILLICLRLSILVNDFAILLRNGPGGLQSPRGEPPGGLSVGATRRPWAPPRPEEGRRRDSPGPHGLGFVSVRRFIIRSISAPGRGGPEA
jgi:hypothetical protein